ncbi:MAG: pseudouridine synthase [Rhodobacterales bacterium]|nr:pseudouridine synthase [Rhodobacterales bacterium]
MSKSPSVPPPAPTKGERIAKVLARAGIASRRDAERLIAEGRVRVNGKPIDSPALNISGSDRVSVDGKALAAPEPPRLWLYHKPAGLVTTEKDEKDRQTVFDTLPADMPRVMSVGRLDLNSEGLLILTNDGAVKRRLELPATGWLRRYRVRINGSVSEERLEQLRRGITVEGVEYQPMGVTFDRQQGANAWLTVTLREGKNREIRRTMEAIGVTVNRLIRISYGPFQLGSLKPGEVEELKSRVVRDQLGLDARPQPVRKGRPAAPDAPDAPDARPARPARSVPARSVPARSVPARSVKGDTAAAQAPRTAAKPVNIRARPAGDSPASARDTAHHVVKPARYARAADDSPAKAPAKSAPRSAGRLSHGGSPDKPARAAGFKSHKAPAARADGDPTPARSATPRPKSRPKTPSTRNAAPPAGPKKPPRKG